MKRIEKYPGYFITEDGDIWSEKSGTLQMLHPFRKKQDGDVYVTLWKDGCAKITKVSKLMVKTFMGKMSGCRLVHMDGDLSNNRLSNLVLVSKN